MKLFKNHYSKPILKTFFKQLQLFEKQIIVNKKKER